MFRRSRRESGQAAVETAITMPLFVFVVLGIVQLGLLHQCRLLTKYAAYKAARAGSINRGIPKVMNDAAIAVMMPLLTRPNPISAGSGGTQPQYGLYKVNSASDFASSFKDVAESRNNKDNGHPIVELTVCHPLSSDVDETKDFDDPKTNPLGGNSNWRQFQATSLAVQVTAYFKMIIPFANGMIWWASYGKLTDEQIVTMKNLRMKHDGSSNETRDAGGTFSGNPPYTLPQLVDLAKQGNYIMPVRSSYSLRMHSNFSPKSNLPSQNLCHVPFDRK
ncbi:MAG: TadE family protein [Myxococcaceae bacterium]